MRLLVRFVIPLLGVLALLAWAAAALVNSTLSRWFDRDVQRRAELAVNGACTELVQPWMNSDRSQVTRVLSEISRDERIIGAAACDCNLAPIASSSEYPASFDCKTVGAHVWEADPSSPGRWKWKSWDQMSSLPGGSVHVSAFPVADEKSVRLGFIAVVQDLSYADQREALARRYTLAAFAMLAMCASALTALVARLSWIASSKLASTGSCSGPLATTIRARSSRGGRSVIWPSG